MKKQMFIMTALVLGLSCRSFAATGSANDGFLFLLAIVGLLLIVFCLLSGVDYLKKNGKILICKAIISVKKMIVLLKDLLHRVKSVYFDPSYF